MEPVGMTNASASKVRNRNANTKAITTDSTTSRIPAAEKNGCGPAPSEGPDAAWWSFPPRSAKASARGLSGGCNLFDLFLDISQPPAPPKPDRVGVKDLPGAPHVSHVHAQASGTDGQRLRSRIRHGVLRLVRTDNGGGAGRGPHRVLG